MKKTIEIKMLKDRINKYLSLDTLNNEEKSSLSFLLETILNDTNNYNGFIYLFDWNSITKEEAETKKYNRFYF